MCKVFQILCSNVEYTCTCINVLWFNFISSENINYQGSRTRFELLNTTLSSNQYITNGSVDSWFKSYTDWLDTNPAAASGKTTSKYFVIYGIFLLLINLHYQMQYYLMLFKECDTIMNLDKLKNLKLFLRNNEIDGLSGCLIGITLHLVWLV